MSLLTELNPEQREAAIGRGHLSAIACPGSGKTKTLASKAATFLLEGGTVAAVTFTRDAALELRERIILLAGEQAKSRLLVGTFHSVCLLMASPKARVEYGTAILSKMKSPFKKKWELVVEGQRRGYVLRAMEETGYLGELKTASQDIEFAKGMKFGPGVSSEQAALARAYQDILERAGKIDFQDIILNTNEALADKSMTALPVDFLMVDEFQDTDAAQYEWVRHHALAGVACTIVGDDDQSIYGFRRALGYDGLSAFADEFSAYQVLLGTNYRCHSEILGKAGNLIAKNTERIPKQLFAAKGEGGDVRAKKFPSDADEAAAAGDFAAKADAEGSTCAVIARTNRRLDLIESELIFHRVPFTRSDGESLFNLPEVAVYHALMRALMAPKRVDLDHVLAWAGMSEDDLSKLHRLFGEKVAIGAPHDFKNAGVTPVGAEIWRSFAKRFAEWSRHFESNRTAILRAGVMEWLTDHLKKPYTLRNLETAHSLFDPKDKSLKEKLDLLA
ncbi:MAG: ATP-dependent helicase, partial [Burkholderiales bacterium]|nr:ATP-dependent helicase [Burkholderiales bacterium]